MTARGYTRPYGVNKIRFGPEGHFTISCQGWAQEAPQGRGIWVSGEIFSMTHSTSADPGQVVAIFGGCTPPPARMGAQH
jgi:hypothetical protein